MYKLFRNNKLSIKKCTKCVLNLQQQSVQMGSTYTSSIALEKLYPNSKLESIYKTPEKPPTIPNSFSGYIPIEELDIKFEKDHGPLGEEWHIPDTRVTITFDLYNCTWIEAHIKEKMKQKFKTRITKDGYFVMRSELTRYRDLNVAHCLDKLRTIIWNCYREPIALPQSHEQDLIQRLDEQTTMDRLVIKD